MAILAKKHRKPSELQENILIEISQHGSSKSLLDKNLSNYYSDISDAVDILKDKRFISKRFEKKGRGKKEIYYGLTDEGIEYLISQDQFTQSDFWKMLFFIYDSTNQHEVTITEEELLESYIQNKLKITRFTPFYAHYLENFSSFIRDEEHQRCLKVLKHFGMNGKISLVTILNKFSKNDQAIAMNLLAENNFLYFFKVKNKKYYELSHFGFLYLLNFLKNRIENKDDIETIIYNHTHLFPRIFKKWNTLLREKELSRLLWILTRLYFDPFQLSIDDLNVSYSLKLKGTLLNMEISKREQMVDFINKANLALTEWIRDKGIESKISVWDLTPEISKKEFPSISRLLQKIIQIHKSRPLVMAALIQGDYVADEEYDEYEFYRKQISESTKDLVSFQFYSLLRFDINQPLWNKISKNQEFVQWYSNWLNAIIESEEENLKLLKTISV